MLKNSVHVRKAHIADMKCALVFDAFTPTSLAFYKPLTDAFFEIKFMYIICRDDNVDGITLSAMMMKCLLPLGVMASFK